MTVSEFGRAPDGRPVERVVIEGGGLRAAFLTWGATLQDLRMEGVGHPLVLGAEEFGPYLDALLYSGAIVGRFANRIRGGRFAIAGTSFQADRNFRGRHLLHGGTGGSGQMLWRIADLGGDHVTFSLHLPDGHMGFPGDMSVEARFFLPGNGVLALSVVAQCNHATPCNFAQHSYFNLDGAASIRSHVLQIMAAHYLPVDEDLIPTGEIAPVAGTGFDFRAPRPIGDRGYDHNFCTGRARDALRPVAILCGGAGSVSLTVETTEPGLQLYDGAHLDLERGLEGRRYGRCSGVALEAQLWPDAPNLAGAAHGILPAGETSRQELRYVFRRM
ncbi:aldose epimerase family protein [Mangrovicoccus algicola]|uniref:Galactose mutarotase n=1 Tax=Mangrovicoccus algicola TaxID=2771008 RepID=A0A8J6Z976_9RHOB|nr:galactose mutarotase [Mangrovicoccus algicola]